MKENNHQCPHYSKEFQQCTLAELPLKDVNTYCAPNRYKICSVYRCLNGWSENDDYCTELTKRIGLKQ